MHSDEKLAEDEEIKESDNPLYSSRFDYDWERQLSVNYCKILVVACY